MDEDEEISFWARPGNLLKVAVVAIIAITVLIIALRPATDTSKTTVEKSATFRGRPEPKMVENIPKVDTDAGKYYVVKKDRAYFHDKADEESIRNAYLVMTEKIRAVDETDGYIYIEFTNPRGSVMKGWINKNDLDFPRK